MLAELKSIGFEKIKHCGKESYQKGYNEIRRGVDFKIYGEHGQLTVAGENKNWKTLRTRYSKDIAQTEVIDRFEGIDAKYEVLFIPDANVFDRQALALIRSHGIHIFETEKMLGGKDFHSKFFYILKARLEQFFENLETQTEQQSQREQQQLTQYVEQHREEFGIEETNNSDRKFSKLVNQQSMDYVTYYLDNYTNDNFNKDTPSQTDTEDNIATSNETKEESSIEQRKMMLKGTLWHVD